MKTFMSLIIFLLGAIIFPSFLKAQESDKIIAAAKGAVEALNKKDADAYMDYLHPDFTRFLPQNPGLLKDTDLRSMKESFDNGMQFNMQLEDLEIASYGNTAIVTGYETGPANFPDGSVVDGKRKYTSVWIKENGLWKEVHLHISMVQD